MKKKLIIIIPIIIALLAFVFVYRYYNKEDKTTTLTVSEKRWVQENKEKTYDFEVVNDYPLYGMNGSGVIFDFLNDFEQNVGIEFNKIPYLKESKPSGNSYRIRILDNEDKLTDKDLFLFNDSYIAVGKTKKEIKTIYNELLKRGALSYTTMVVATNDDKQPVISLIPFVGLSIAEEYMKMGKDVIVVIDDLKKHADTYREISLVSNKTPGREAYPADIFYLHARLLEKGCQYKNGGSITILPIVETKGGDITDYISTNIISITDGQIVLSEKEFAKGNKPAINYKNSVSRLGGAVQKPEIKKLGAKVRRTFLSYLETKEVYELANIDEMTPELRNKMKIGKQIQEALNQPKFSPLSNEEIIEKFEAIVKQEGKIDEN